MECMDKGSVEKEVPHNGMYGQRSVEKEVPT